MAWRHGVYAFLIIVGAALGALWGLNGVATAAAVATAIYYALSAQLANRLLGVSWSQFVCIHGPSLASAAVLWLMLRLSEPFISEAGSAFVELGVSLTLTAAVLVLLYALVPARFLGTEALDIVKATADGLRGAPFPLRFRS